MKRRTPYEEDPIDRREEIAYEREYIANNRRLAHEFGYNGGKYRNKNRRLK